MWKNRYFTAFFPFLDVLLFSKKTLSDTELLEEKQVNIFQ